jgi:Ca2+-binding RTX toxin-like protein
MRRRAGSIAATTIVIALSAAGSAQGALTTALEGDTIRVFSDTPAEQNFASMGIDANDGLIVDDSAGALAGFCAVSGGDRILLGDCVTPAVERFSFEFGGGDDRFFATDPRLILFNATPGRVSVAMGAGDDDLVAVFGKGARLGPGDDHAQGFIGRDRIRGGAGNDLLEGGGSSDILSGGGGRDRLYGGWRQPSKGLDPGDGRDTFLGGGGADRLFAWDFTKDRRIDCGPGSDRLRRDRFDPRPKRC